MLDIKFILVDIQGIAKKIIHKRSFAKFTEFDTIKILM